jgi:hypothetical protein
MNTSFLFLLLFLTGILLMPGKARTQGIGFQNELTFYDDNEEFNEPFRISQTFQGEQLKSLASVSTGGHTAFRAGLFAEDRNQDSSFVGFKPILTFEYDADTTRLLMGTIENQNRHGFIEPLEVSTLSITRPVEYGLQWLEKTEGFHSDVFLDWQQVDQIGQDEIFDYGGVLQAPMGPMVSVEMQFHAYHEGGRIFNLRVVNNYNPALGVRLAGSLGFLGDGHLNLFAVTSSDFEGKFTTGPNWGRGLYAQGSIAPGNWVEMYGLYWSAQDFFSQEGDPNYNSQGINPSFYRSGRSYEEAGLRKEIHFDSGIQIDGEAKSCWIDEFWGWALHITAQIPFEIGTSLSGSNKPMKEGPDAL